MTELFNIQALSLAFNDHTIYDRVDLTIHEGQHTAIKGQSGSGKSTLLKILCGLQPYDEGTITFKGKPLYDYDYRKLRQRVAYVTQTPQLFGHTVQENLYFPFEIRNEEPDTDAIHTLMDAVNLGDIDLDTDISTLSGGERQRVGLVRSLIIPSEVLLLDEITSALDKNNQQAVEQVLQDFADGNGTTLIWVAHHATEITVPKQTVTVNGDGTINVIDGDNTPTATSESEESTHGLRHDH